MDKADKSQILIPWKKMLKDERVLYILKDYASRSISFEEMKERIVSTSPILEEQVRKMDIVGNDIIMYRSQCALNKNGTPISGFRLDVEFLP